MIVEMKSYELENRAELSALLSVLAEEESLLDSEIDGFARPVCAFTDGELIGFFVIQPPKKHLGYGTLILGIKPDSRECGVGRKLVSAALEDATKKGYGSLVAVFASDNRAAKGLAETMGFRRAGKLSKGWKKAQSADLLLYEWVR